MLCLATSALAGCALRRGRELLREGRAQTVLETVRPHDAAALRLRAMAFRALGRARDAQVELRISLALEPGSAEGQRLLGFAEAQLGNQGEALRRFEQAVRLDPRDRAARWALAGLLLHRAALRLDPLLGLRQRRAADKDLRRARELDPRLSSMIRTLRARRAGARRCESRAARCSRRASSARSHPVTRCRHRSCTRVSQGVLRPSVPSRALQRGRCRLRRPDEGLRELRQRQLLLACGGPSLALRLEDRGCLRSALRVWEALQEESPEDPRWSRQIARLLLALGRNQAAQIAITDYAYLAPDRSAALLDAARLLISAGDRKHAGQHAVEALALTRKLETQLEVLRLLRAAGMRAEAREAAEYVLHLASQRGRVADQLRDRVGAAIGEPRFRRKPGP